MASSSKEFSIINFSGENYPATDLIRDLVGRVSDYASQLNRAALFNLVARATDLHNSINGLISIVEREDNDSWVNYDKYNDALDLLEE